MPFVVLLSEAKDTRMTSFGSASNGPSRYPQPQPSMPASIKPGMPLLLAVLRGEPTLSVDDHQWQEALDLAAAESILPWLTHLLLDADPKGCPMMSAALSRHRGRNPVPPISPAITQSLQQAQREAQINAFLYTAELTSLLKSFATANIPVLLLKGPSFAERVYGSAALRPTRDLDLLVRSRHFDPAQRLLLSLGFLPNSLPDDYHQSLTRNTVTVELHFDVENPHAFDFHLPSAWQNAQLIDFHGQPAHAFAPPDELLYLALHAVRHRYGRLSYILDLALASQHHGRSTEPRRQTKPLANLLTLGTAMIHKLLPAFTTFPADPHTAGTANRLWQRLLTQPEAELNWQTLHRFYVELEPTPIRRLVRRLRHLRILATRLTQPDRDYAARFGLPYRWAARLLRPLRLLTHRGAP